MCRLLAASLAASLVLAASAAAAGSSAAEDTDRPRSQEGAEGGPERCLASDAPFWCLAEETSAGLSSMFGGTATGKSTGTDPLQAVTDFATSAFDMITSSGEIQEESRGKRRRKMAFILMVIATILAVIIPIKLKAIAVMATAALLVGKLALIVASVIGLKKLVHKPEDTTHVHYTGHRSDADSHYLAYSEQMPPMDSYAPPEGPY